MPLFGPPDVGRMEARRDIGGLARALRYQANSQFGGHVMIRQNAAQALGRIADPSSVPALTAVLGSQDTSVVREAAAAALGQIGDPRAAEALIAALGDNMGGVGKAASAALRSTGGPRVVDRLIAALASGNRTARQAAIELLGDLGDARASRPLIGALADKEWATRSKAAAALGKLGDAQAVDRLIAAMRDENAWVRAAAAIALGQIGDPRAMAPLVAALRDNELSVRCDAARALQQLRKARGPINGATADEMQRWLKDLAEQCERGVRAEAVIESAERAGYAADDAQAQARASNDRVFQIRQILREKGGEPLVREVVALAAATIRVAAFEYLKERWAEADLDR